MPKGIPNTNAVAPGRIDVPNTDPNFQEFPKMLYYLGDGTNWKIVNSASEEAELGPKWYDRPQEVPDPEPAE